MECLRYMTLKKIQNFGAACFLCSVHECVPAAADSEINVRDEISMFWKEFTTNQFKPFLGSKFEQNRCDDWQWKPNVVSADWQGWEYYKWGILSHQVQKFEKDKDEDEMVKNGTYLKTSGKVCCSKHFRNIGLHSPSTFQNLFQKLSIVNIASRIDMIWTFQREESWQTNIETFMEIILKIEILWRCNISRR